MTKPYYNVVIKLLDCNHSNLGLKTVVQNTINNTKFYKLKEQQNPKSYKCLFSSHPIVIIASRQKVQNKLHITIFIVHCIYSEKYDSTKKDLCPFLSVRQETICTHCKIQNYIKILIEKRGTKL